MSAVILRLLSPEKKLRNSIGVCCPDGFLYLKVGFVSVGWMHPVGKARLPGDFDSTRGTITERTVFVEASTLTRHNEGAPFRLPSPYGFIGIGSRPDGIATLSTEDGYFQFARIGSGDGLDDIFQEAFDSHMGLLGL